MAIHHICKTIIMQNMMFNKEQFHNALALSLGYECIVKDKRITIDADDSDAPLVTLKI